MAYQVRKMRERKNCHGKRPVRKESKEDTGGETVKEPWIVFFDVSGEEICAFTVRGMMHGEIGETIGLLAYERGISTSEISFAEVTR
ncbi:MAG: hypothetical protein RSC06_15010 [Clostridia bacterium]